VNILTMTDNII